MKFYPSFKLSLKWRDLGSLFYNVCFNKNVKNDDFGFLNKYIPHKYIIPVPSSRWGLVFLLQALGFKEEDEIIVPAYTYFAVPSAIVKAGCRPVFVDVESGGINIDVSKIEKMITPKTKAVIATHLCGFPCDIYKIKEIASKYNLCIIEDCAQSLGAEYDKQKVGSFGKVSYFSFSMTKNMTMLGGGIISTNDKDIAGKVKDKMTQIDVFNKFYMFKEIIKSCIIKTVTSKLTVPAANIMYCLFALIRIDIAKIIFKEKKVLLDDCYPENGQFNEFQAQLAIRQIKKFDHNNKIKEKNGMLFYKLCDKNKVNLLNNAVNVFTSVPLFFDDKYNMRKKLLKKGIDTATGFVQSCPSLKEFEKYANGFYPNAKIAERKVLHFLSANDMSEKDIIYICGVIGQYCKN